MRALIGYLLRPFTRRQRPSMDYSRVVLGIGNPGPEYEETRHNAGFLALDHLAAREAGEMAKKAGVKQLTLFHFSPRYAHQEEDILQEAFDAFR